MLFLPLGCHAARHPQEKSSLLCRVWQQEGSYQIAFASELLFGLSPGLVPSPDVAPQGLQIPLLPLPCGASHRGEGAARARWAHGERVLTDTAAWGGGCAEVAPETLPAAGTGDALFGVTASGRGSAAPAPCRTAAHGRPGRAWLQTHPQGCLSGT